MYKRVPYPTYLYPILGCLKGWAEEEEEEEEFFVIVVAMPYHSMSVLCVGYYAMPISSVLGWGVC